MQKYKPTCPNNPITKITKMTLTKMTQTKTGSSFEG